MVVRGWVKTATINWGSLRGPHVVRAPITNIRELLMDEDAADGNTRKRFAGWARGEYRDLRFETDTRIAAEMKRGFVGDYNDLDFEAQRHEASLLTADGHPEVATWMYMGTTESIGVHMNIIDDSGGYVWPFFEECMDNLGRCIMSRSLSAVERRQYVEYLAGWSLVVFSDFMKSYTRVLERLCSTTADLEAWRRTLEPELDRDVYQAPCYWAAPGKYVRDTYSMILDRMGKAGSG